MEWSYAKLKNIDSGEKNPMIFGNLRKIPLKWEITNFYKVEYLLFSLHAAFTN